MKLTNLEEELRRVKLSSVQQNNKNDVIFYNSNKTLTNTVKNVLKEELKINSISKTYENRKVVNNVSLHLRRGEAVGLLGPNGAGKTTCFYMIS